MEYSRYQTCDSILVHYVPISDKFDTEAILVYYSDGLFHDLFEIFFLYTGLIFLFGMIVPCIHWYSKLNLEAESLCQICLVVW
jgi:hypothetical protein